MSSSGTSSSKPWTGEQELQSVLQELCGHRSNVPSSKIRQVVSIANKHVTDFKMVVYEIEKFVKKAANEDKMSGLFVLDSLCRQHSKDRETFAKRFGVRLKETVSYFNKVTSKEKETIKRTVEEWRKKGIFPADTIYSLRLEGVDLNAPVGDSPVKSNHSSHWQDLADEQEQEAKKSEDSKKKQKRDEHKSHRQILPDKKEIKKAVKLCPFREGSCPFGDKCRFNHSESNNLEQYAARLVKQRKANEIVDVSYERQRDLIETLIMHDIQYPDNLDCHNFKLNPAALCTDQTVRFPSNAGNPMDMFERRKELFEVVPGAQIDDPIVYNANKRSFEQLLSK